MIREAWACLNEYYLFKEEAEYLEGCSNLFWGTLYDFVESDRSLYWENFRNTHRQQWPDNPIGLGLEYSPLFIDLIDDYNQQVIEGGGIGFVDDMIVGYTPTFLSMILRNNQYDYNELKEMISVNLPDGITSEDIEYFFEQYEPYWVE